MFRQGILERIGLLTTGTGVLGYCDVNGKIISINNFKKIYGLSIFISLTHKIIYIL